MLIQNIYRLLIGAAVALSATAGFSQQVYAGPQAKVYVCHKERSIRINGNAEHAHINHGDLPGKCGEVVVSEWLNLQCSTLAGEAPTGSFAVSSVAGSEGIPNLLASVPVDTNCAVAQQLIQSAICRLVRDYGTPEVQTYVFNCAAEAPADPD